jgi:hypothetical protein
MGNKGPKPFIVGGECRKGHSLTGDNFYMEGTRVRCRICYNIKKNLPEDSRPTKVSRLIPGEKCTAGHVLIESVIYTYPNGKICCKICRMNVQRRRKGLPESDSIGVWNRNKTVCANGHEYTEENTFIKSNGSRQCIICRDINRFNQRAAKYGLSPQELRKMLDESGDRCEICGQESDLHVDHDHETGKVRGLLCSSHNTMLGQARDSIEILQSAILYLTRYKNN